MSASGNLLVRYLRRLGAGSLLISVIIHLVVIIVATIYVVSSVVEKREAKFQGGGNGGPSGPPASVTHSVQMARTQPTLANLTQRLAVDSPNASVGLPDMPDMPGLAIGAGPAGTAGGLGGPGSGAGFGAGSGSGPVMPLFGFRDARPGGALVGRLYDFKQNPSKEPNPLLNSLGPQKLAIKEVSSFLRANCREETLRQFLRSPNPLYATQIFVPVMSADEAPKAYGVEKYVQPKAWMAHYKGRVSPPKTATYRFVGAGDDLMAVRLDGRLVLDCGGEIGSTFKSDRPESPNYAYDYQDGEWVKRLRGGFVVGHRMELRAGLFYDIDILFSEGPGGKFCAMLLVEEEGATYAKDRGGRPILPVFRVADTPMPPPSPGAPPVMADGPVWRALPVTR